MKNIFYISLFLLISFVGTPVSAGSLESALDTSASGMRSQSERMKIVTENIANADTIGINPNDDPYRRKTIYFQEVKDPYSQTKLVTVRKVARDNSDFKLAYQPNHPAANADGYIKTPNVDKNLEAMDLKESQRSYEANVSAIENTKQIMERTLDLMR